MKSLRTDIAIILAITTAALLVSCSALRQAADFIGNIDFQTPGGAVVTPTNSTPTPSGDSNTVPGGSIRIGRTILRPNTIYAPSGLSNGDTATIKPRSSDGDLKCSAPHTACTEWIALGLNDTGIEVAFIDPVTGLEIGDRGTRVAPDMEVPGRTKWNHRRMSGCKELPANVIVVWVRKGTKIVPDTLIPSLLYIQVPDICQNRTPQYEVPQ